MENLIWPRKEKSPPLFHYLKLDKSFDYSEPMLLSSKETVLQFALTLLNPSLGFKYTFETIILTNTGFIYYFHCLHLSRLLLQKSAFVKHGIIQCYFIPSHKTFKNQGKTLI